MDVYAGKDEQTLRKLLDNTTDYSERRKIRSAIRGLKNTRTNNNNNNNLTEYEKPKATFSSTIDGGSRHLHVETTVSRSHHHGNIDNDGEGGGDDDRVHKTRYRRRMQAEEERQKALEEEKEEHPKTKLEDINDEDVLTKLLKDTTVYEERKKIRAAIRELRRKKEENAKATESYQDLPVSSRTRTQITTQQTTTEMSTPREPKTTIVKSESTSSTDFQKKTEKTLEKESGKDEIKQTTSTKTVKIEDINDEEVLKQMLKETEDYDQRKKIRTALREIRKKNREKPSQEDDTKESAKGANHTSGTSVQIENKELEKRNGQVAMEINFDSSGQGVAKSPVTVPKVILQTHSKTKLEKFDVPTMVARQPSDAASNRTVVSNVGKAATKSDTERVTVQKGKTITMNLSRDASKNVDTASKNVKMNLTAAKVEPKTESSNKTAIKVQLTQGDKNRRLASLEDDDDEDVSMEGSWEDISDIGILENFVMVTPDPVERLKIRTKIRELKKKELEQQSMCSDEVETSNRTMDMQNNQPQCDSKCDNKCDSKCDNTRDSKCDNTCDSKCDNKVKEGCLEVVPVDSKEARKVIPKTWREDVVEIRPDPNTKITTTVMKLSKPTMEGERVEKEIVNEQKTDTGVKKTTKTMITLATTPKNGNNSQISASDDVPLIPKKTYLSRTLVAKEMTDDYSSCYTSEEEEETVVKTHGQNTYTTKTRVITKKFETTDNKTGIDFKDNGKPGHSTVAISSAGQRRRAPSSRDVEFSDSSDSEDDVDGAAGSKRSIRGQQPKKGVNTAKDKPDTKPAEKDLPKKEDKISKKEDVAVNKKVEWTANKKAGVTVDKKVEAIVNKKVEVLIDKTNLGKVEEKQTERHRQQRQGQGETKEQSQGEPHKEVNSSDSSSDMAPTPIEEIEDEGELEKMLDAATDFDERRKIRTQLRDVRRKRREERDRKMAERERAREIEKKERMAAADKRRIEKLGAGLANKASLTSSTTTSTSSTNKNDNTTNKTITANTDKNANTTVSTTKDSTPSKSVTTTTEKKTDGGTTMQKTTTVTESKDGGGGLMSVKTVSSSSSSSSTTGGSGRRMSKFEEELEAKKRAREAKRGTDLQSFKDEAAKRQQAMFERKKMDAMSSRNKRSAIMDKFGGQAKTGPSFGGGVGRGGGGRMMVQNANTIKAQLLEWAKIKTAGYTNCSVENFSRSWSDGMAFCALIHHYYPDSFDYNKLNPRNKKFNFDLAFRTAEKEADIMPLLDTEDMLLMGNKPDWKCVFCYVQSLYRHLSKQD
ncbi:uncharacterized protein LOC144448788 isoform X2 [Glandiceps talaboti]